MKLVLQAFIIALLMVLSAAIFKVDPSNVFVVIGSFLVGTIITEAIYFKKIQKEVEKREAQKDKEKTGKDENKSSE